MAVDKPMESFLRRAKCSCDPRDPESSCIVCGELSIKISDYSTNDSHSVSSVNTLEEAKVARGCLYMQMPVHEVCATPSFLPMQS